MTRKIKYLYVILLVFFVLSLSFIGFVVYRSSMAKKLSERQAVFLSNGQVYFGNIIEVNKDFLVLKNIYYLKEQSKLSPEEQTDDKKISIIKLGDELHGPEDKMYISRNQVLFYENMKNSSKINEAIKKYLDQKNSAQK